jgi:hypothetical protein
LVKVKASQAILRSALGKLKKVNDLSTVNVLIVDKVLKSLRNFKVVQASTLKHCSEDASL